MIDFNLFGLTVSVPFTESYDSLKSVHESLLKLSPNRKTQIDSFIFAFLQELVAFDSMPKDVSKQN